MIIMLAASAGSDAAAQGMRFHGNESVIAERSALTIPHPDTRQKPTDRLEVKFSIRVNNIASSGFIFGIKNRTTDNMLNLMLRNDVTADSVYLSFTKEGERELCTVAFPASDIASRRIDIGVMIDRPANSAKLSIDGKSFTVTDLEIGGKELVPQLNFGLTRHIVETASVTLSNLSLTADGTTREIPLNEREGTVVHDSDGNVTGLAFNPLWQINEAFYWRKLVEFSSPTPTGCAFDPLAGCFYSYNCDSIAGFNAAAQTLSRTPLTGERKLPVLHGMNFFSTKRKKIYPYEIYYDDFSGEIDPATGIWRTLATTDDNKAIHHHAHLLCQNDSAIILFGGYGDRRYFNKLVKFNLFTHRFDTIPLKGTTIPPRFFASIAATPSGDSIYLYGGKGNREGKQDLGVKYFYDLYLINLKDSTTTLLWQQNAPEKDRVPARTLLLDKKAGYIYAMAYPEYRPNSALQLYRISIADGSETAVGDTIPMISEEIATNVALHTSAADIIYCVIQEFEKEGATNTRIYSIAAPPVSESELLSYTYEEDKRSRSALIFPGIGILVVIVAIVAVVIYRRRKNSASASSLASEPLTPEPAPVEEPKPVEEPEPTVEPDPIEEPVIEARRSRSIIQELPAANRISLFGPFTAIDASGINISHMFSPKLKYIFIFILMGSLKRGGVTAAELSAAFWPDKEPDKIKNLRNVTIAKLRKIVGEFQGLEIRYENGLFSVVVERDCYCDIQHLYALTDKLATMPADSDREAEIMTIFSQGKFLLRIDVIELDPLISPVETYALNYMMRYMQQEADARHWEEAAWCAGLILQTDPLSDVALKIGVKAYVAMDNKEKARNMYRNFTYIYRKAYSEDCPWNFSDLIKK